MVSEDRKMVMKESSMCLCCRKSFNFFFYVRVEPMDNVVIVSDVQQSDPAIHIPLSIHPQTPRLPHNMEQSFLRCTVGPCWLSVLKNGHHQKISKQ